MRFPEILLPPFPLVGGGQNRIRHIFRLDRSGAIPPLNGHPGRCAYAAKIVKTGLQMLLWSPMTTPFTGWSPGFPGSTVKLPFSSRPTSR